LAVLVACGAVLASAGCGPEEAIRHYQIPRPAPTPGSEVQFTVPEEWEAAEKVVSRGGITIEHKAAFKVVDGEEEVAITVDRLPGGGSLSENAVRWSMQIGLQPAPASEFKAAIEEIEIGGMRCEYIELQGETESVFAAVVSKDKPTWYIKLKGPNELAASERERFQSFLESMQFE
jgi:hypothetical protein